MQAIFSRAAGIRQYCGQLDEAAAAAATTTTVLLLLPLLLLLQWCDRSESAGCIYVAFGVCVYGPEA